MENDESHSEHHNNSDIIFYDDESLSVEVEEEGEEDENTSCIIQYYIVVCDVGQNLMYGVFEIYDIDIRKMPEQRAVRRPTLLVDVWDMPEENTIVVKFNIRGQPIDEKG